MDILSAQRRAIHAGALGLAASFAIGLPYSFVVLRSNAEDFNEQDKEFINGKGKDALELGKKIPGTERAWKMAHLESLTNGFLALLVAALIPSMRALTPTELSHLANSTLALVVGNTIGSVSAAIGGTRGLMNGGSKMGVFAYWNYMVAVAAAPVTVWYLVKGVRKI